MFKIINQPNQLSAFVSEPISPRASWSHSTFRPLTLGLLFSSLIFQACGLDIEDPTPPSPPIWIQKSLPEEWPERGIDAHESGGIYLEWEPNPKENIRVYLIYRAQYYDANDSLGYYDLLSRLEINETSSLSHLDSDVSLETQYYYRMKAEDEAGNRSVFSDSLSFSLLPQILIGRMSPNGLGDRLNSARNLFWSYDSEIEMENYCLTITDANGSFVHRQLFSPGNYVGGDESKELPASLILVSGEVYRWRIDTGAKYINDLETVASESHWATFLYMGE
jgi:hypothetical protein